MINKAGLALAIVLFSFAPINFVVADKSQIIEDVLTEKGFYDADEIEKRLRFEVLNVPLEVVEGGALIDDGGCFGKDCYSQLSGLTNPLSHVPALNGINGIQVGGNYTPDMRIKFNVNTISQSELQLLEKFQIIFIKSNAKTINKCLGPSCQNFTHWYTAYEVKPEFKPTNEIKRKQFISTSGLSPGSYSIALRAVYQSMTSEFDYSEWSNVIEVNVFSHDLKLSDIDNGIIKNCLFTNGYTANELVADIDKIECSNQGLTDADIIQITQYFSGVRYINISNNPALTGIGALGKLPHLKILDISENPNFNTANLGNFGDLDALIMRNMGQTNMLMPVPPHNATYVDYSGNHFTTWQPIYEDRRDNAIESLNLSNTNFATANVSTLLTTPSSGDVYINAIDLSDTPFDDVSSIASIKDLKHVNVNNAELADRQDLTGISGLCSLSMADTNILSLAPVMPVQYLNLKNNTELRLAKPLQSAEYRPHWTDLSGSNALKCHKYYSYLDKSQPGSGITPLTDFSVLDPGNFTKPLPQCETQATSTQYNPSDFCKPAPVLKANVYEDINTSKRVIHWQPNPNHNYVRWGVTHYLITAYKNGNIVNEFTSSFPSTTLVTNSFDPDKYTVSICTEYQCGYNKEVTEFKQGLTKVFDSSGFWDLTDSNNLTFQLKFKYPQLVFDEPFGKPDYFEITPGFNQPGHNDPIIISVTNRNGNCIKGDELKPCDGDDTLWFSEPIYENQYIGKDFIIKACRYDIGCGPHENIRLPNPIISADLPIPEWVGPLISNEPTGTNINISWNSDVYLDENVDYIEVTEQQPVRNAMGDYDQQPTSKFITYYIESDSTLNLTRLVKGTYKFNLKACTRNRETGDVCSSFSNDKTVHLFRNEISFSNSQPYNVYKAFHNVPGGVSSETVVFKESIHNKPDYYLFSAYSGLSSCSGFGTTTEIIQSSNVNIVKLTTSPYSQYISAYYACKNPHGDENITIKSCFDGIGCNKYANATNFEYQNLTDIGTVEFLNQDNGLNSNPIGGPGDMRPGAWWNPLINGTGWHFHWANELRYPSMHDQYYGETYDLLGIWMTYQLIDDDWSPVWMRAHLKKENDPSNPATCENFDCSRYFEGDLTYVTRDFNGITHHKVGHIQVFFDSENPNIPDGNRDVLLKMDIDTNDGLLTLPGVQFPDNENCEYNNNLPTETSDRNCPWLSADGSLYMPLSNYDNTAYGNPNIGGTENDINHYSGMWSPTNTDGTVDTVFTYMVDIIRNYEWATLLFYDNDGLPIWGLSDSCCAKTTEDKLDLTYYSLQRGFDPLNFTPDDWSVSEHAFEIGSDLANNRTFSAPDITGYRDMNLQVFVNGGGQWSGGRQASVYTGGQRTLAKQASFHDIRFFVNGQNETITECDPNTAANGECVIKFTWFTDDDFIDIKPFYRKDNGALTSLTELCGLPLQDSYVVTDYTCTIYQPGNYKFELAKPSEVNVGDWVTIAESNELTIEECNSQSCMVNTPLTSETPFQGPLESVESGSEEVGKIAANFQVDNFGQANYSIPIFAGKGTAGVSPKVAINYSSNGANGHLGVGWSLSGINVITRCRETQESRDGNLKITPKPLSFSVGDKFCLGGERLFAISGVYGEPNTEYRTELDQFARIISYGGSNNNPDYFTVERKDGSISYYGNTDDSNITVDLDNNGTTDSTYAWSINQYKDSLGNYINYVYNRYGNLEFAIKDIEYTGNESQNLLPYNKISFTYDDARTDKHQGFVSGQLSQVTKRLTKITSYIDGTEVRSYKPTYVYSSKTGRLKIDSVKECSGLSCINPTTFVWTDVNTGFTIEKDGDAFQTFPNIKTSKTGDINGDGRADLVYVDQDDEFKIALANGFGGFCTENGCGADTTYSITAHGVNSDKQWHLLDYNADGLMDLIRQELNTSTTPNQYDWKVHLAQVNNNKFGFTGISVPIGVTTPTISELEVIDVNGDGLTDLLFVDNDVLGDGSQMYSVKLLERINDGSTNLISGYKFSDTTYHVNLPIRPTAIDDVPNVEGAFLYYKLLPGSFSDVNADGMVDLFLKVDVVTHDGVINSGDSYYVLSGDESASDGGSSRGAVTVHSSHLIAFESMGMSGNLVNYNQISQYIGTFDYEDANGSIINGHISRNPSSLKIVDINSDGISDLIYYSNDLDSWQFQLGTGLDYTDAQEIIIPSSINVDGKYLQLFDYNADGNIDFVYPGNDITNSYQVLKWKNNQFSNQVENTNATASEYDSGLSSNFNIFMDFNGDGLVDHFRINPLGQQKIRLAMGGHKPVDKITDFVDGYGGVKRVRYKPMTFSTLYAEGDHKTPYDWGNGSPVFDFKGKMYLVEYQFTSSPSQGIENDVNYISYKYSNAKLQSGGRGFLGFGEIITMTPTETADGVRNYYKTITKYRQDFPYIGMTDSSEVYLVSEELSSGGECDLDDCFPPVICYPGQICNDPQRAGAVTETLMSESQNWLEHIETHDNVYFPYVRKTFEYSYSPDSPENAPQLLKKKEFWTVHDNYGNPKSNTIVIRNANGDEVHRKIAVNYYCNIPESNTYCGDLNGSTKWITGLLEISVIENRQDGESIFNRIHYDYDYHTGLKSTTFQEKNSTDAQDGQIDGLNNLYIKNVHQYDALGNEEKTIICSESIADCLATPTSSDENDKNRVHRYKRFVYDLKGRYVDQVFSSTNHDQNGQYSDQMVSQVISRDIYGNPTQSIDALGVITTNTYDVFGRLQTTRNTHGQWKVISRQWCVDIENHYLACSDGQGLAVRTKTLTAGGGESYSYQDLAGRTVYQVDKTFNTIDNALTDGDDRYTFTKKWFDRYGRQKHTEGPYFLNPTNTANVPINSIEYDKFNRTTAIILPDGSTETIRYDGLITHRTNAKGQMKKEKNNILGQLIRVWDFDDGSDPENPVYHNKLAYTYNAQGLLTELKRRYTDDSGNFRVELLNKNEYDILGRKIQSHSVDTGITHTVFNGLGEIIETTDAKGQVVNNYYDSVGRVYKTTSKGVLGGLISTTTNEFDHITGQLLSESKVTHEANGNILFYGTTHDYDQYNRSKSSTITFTDTDNVCSDGMSCVYDMAIYYDQFSRVKFEQDASGEAIQNHYNSNGYLSHVSEPFNQINEYYRTLQTDHNGQVTKDKRGGTSLLTADYYYHPARGWLTDIESAYQDHHYAYDDVGNLLSRTKTKLAPDETDQLECFSYDRLNRLLRHHRYDPNVASTVSGCNYTQDIIEDESIAYDGRGNITLKDGQIYSYLTANSSSVTASPHQVQSKGLQSFSYDANGNNTLTTNFIDADGLSRDRRISYTAFDKIKRVWTENGSGEELASSEYRYDTTENRFYRKDLNAQGEQSVIHFIGNVEVIYNNAGNRETRRQLGNYAIETYKSGSKTTAYLFTDHLGSVDVIVDEAGNVLERKSFTAWGESRDAEYWDAQLTMGQSGLSDFTYRGFTGHEMNNTFGIINMGGRIYDTALGRMLQADPFVQEPTSSKSFNRYTYVFNNPLSYTDPSGYISVQQVAGVFVGIVLTVYLGPVVGSKYWAAFIGGFVGGMISTDGDFEASLVSGFTAVAMTYVATDMFKPAADAKVAPAETAGTKETLGSVGDSTVSNPVADSGSNVGSASQEVSTTQSFNSSNAVNNQPVSQLNENGVLEFSPMKARVDGFNFDLKGIVSRQALMESLLEGGMTVDDVRELADKYLKDKEILNRQKVHDDLIGYVRHFEETMYQFGIVKQQASLVGAAIGLHIAGPLRAGIGATYKGAGYLGREFKGFFSSIIRNKKLMLAFADSVSFVTGEINAIRTATHLTQIEKLGAYHNLVKNQKIAKIISEASK